MGELVLETKPTTPVYQVGDWVIWNSQFEYLAKLNPFQIVEINDDGTCELDIIYHSVPIDSLVKIAKEDLCRK